MKKILTALALGVALVAAGFAAPVSAAPVTGYGKQATTVAKSIKCKNPRDKSGSSSVYKSGLVCDLKGKRINVITFKSEAQQVKWLANVQYAFIGEKAYVAVARGVVIVAKNGNRSAASKGAAALNGAVVPVPELTF